MVCVVEALQAWRGTRVIPTNTLYQKDPPEAIEVIRQGHQINVNWVATAGVWSTQSQSARC
jgi:hypothetical protein